MAYFRRIKQIKEGRSGVILEKIETVTNKNGSVFYKISFRRKSDGAKRDFWISADSYLVEKLIDLFFKNDSRETFEFDEFIGKELAIVVEANENGFYNIKDIESFEELEEEYVEEEYENEEYKEDLSLEKDLFEEDDLFDEEDEFGELDL